MTQSTQVNPPRLLFAGTETGVGKTTLVTGLLRAWTLQGIVTAPFKVGPDYIDPGFLTAGSMRITRNLDTWLVSKKKVFNQFVRGAVQSDIAVVEGVMGLYDGASPTSETGSSAEVAKLIGAPVILVLDAGKLARSAAAVVKGYQKLDRKIKIAGVIFNKTGGEGHYRLLKKAVEKECGVFCLGYLPFDPKLKLPEQHLGLVPVEAASGKVQKWLDTAAKAVTKTIDCRALLKIAEIKSSRLSVSKSALKESPPHKKSVCRIAYAKDETFHFYYPDNIEALEKAGAEMVPFSPLWDASLPEDLDGLYLGGGFPENGAGGLAKNKSMLKSLKHAARSGIPVYAECGGLMLLTRNLVLKNGKSLAMAGAIPGKVTMTPELQRFGYTFMQALRGSLLFQKGESCRGHEFHHSKWSAKLTKKNGAYNARKSKTGPVYIEGYCAKNILASYLHIHFQTKPSCAKRFVARAVAFKNKKS